MKRKRERTSLTGMSEEEGPGEHTHTYTRRLKNSHTIWVHMTSHSWRTHTHTHFESYHICPQFTEEPDAGEKTSERMTSCVSAGLDARAVFMSGDARKTNIKVSEAGVCPSHR